MTKEVFKDYIPANARIIIDYKSTEKVRFHYPREWTYRKAVLHCAFPTVWSFFFVIHIYPLLFFAVYYVINEIYNLATYSGERITVTTQTIIHHNFQDIINILPQISIFLFYLVALPFIITILLAINKERLGKWMPKLGYWQMKLIGYVKSSTFLPKDIRYKKAVIPAFNNVFLRYNATEDFGKFLERVEIWELPFEIERRIFFFWRKTQINDAWFRAVFFFSEKPKKGEMKVSFA